MEGSASGQLVEQLEGGPGGAVEVAAHASGFRASLCNRIQPPSRFAGTGVGESTQGHLQQIVPQRDRPRSPRSGGAQDAPVASRSRHRQQGPERLPLASRRDLAERLGSEQQRTVFDRDLQRGRRVLQETEQAGRGPGPPHIAQHGYDVVSSRKTRISEKLE